MGQFDSDLKIERMVHRSQSWQWAIRSRGFEKLIRFNFFIIGILVVAALFVPWVQTSEGHGRVVAYRPDQRLQEVTTPVAGMIQEWMVLEGQNVKKGDILAIIVDNDPAILDRIQAEKEAAQQRLRMAQLMVQNQKINVERLKQLFQDGIVSQRQLELAEIELAQANSTLAQAQMELNRILVRLSQQQRQTILSPTDGIVHKIVVGAQLRYLKPGDVIAFITPMTSDRMVEAWLPSQDLPFIKEGQSVRIQFQGWPIFQISGLPELSAGTFKGQVQFIEPIVDEHGFFRIFVRPQPGAIWPDPDYLKQGIKARVWVAMNRVPLWFEIWRQLFSLPPMPTPVVKDKNLKGMEP